MNDRIADTLVLTFTRGISLELWQRTGVLAREWAIYERLGGRYRRIVLVTYGGAEEKTIAATLQAGDARLEVVCNDRGAPEDAFALAVADVVAERLRGDARVVVKSNQMDGADVAERIARRLRADGARVGLIVRGGYHWSAFMARRHGADTLAARNASTLEGASCRAADVVVGSTAAMVDGLSWQHGLSVDRARVIPNYVLTPPAAPSSRKAVLVLSAGRLEGQKRFDMLIDAMSIVARSDRNARLHIVGDGELLQPLRAQAQALEAPVDFVGRKTHDALLKMMSGCAVYAQVSAYEGHPKTVIEAQACGSAIVVTDSPGLREVVRHGETGLVADPSAESVAAEILRLLEDAALREKLGAQARERANANYAIEAVLPLEIAAHRDALARGSTPAAHAAAAPVRWEPDLLHAPIAESVEQWARSLHGFTRRLTARRRAEFLMALDEPLYQMQGHAAVEANGGLHPKHHLMKYHDFFVERIRPGERVIDLGSGVGAVACSVAERSGATVVGVEIEPANIAAAEQRVREAGLGGQVSFVRGDITTHRAPGAFDVVILSNVLEHVPERSALLRIWSEWYQPSKILIRVPAFDRDWRTPWKRELGLEWRLDDTHEIEYTLETLKQEVSSAGLVISEQVANWGEYWIVAQAPARVEVEL